MRKYAEIIVFVTNGKISETRKEKEQKIGRSLRSPRSTAASPNSGVLDLSFTEDFQNSFRKI